MNIRDAILRLAILGSILFSGICFSQIKVNKFEDIENLEKSERRNVLIFIYTDWCNYCKAMEQTTFRQQTISDLINQNFYFLTLDAEERANITFYEKTYGYQPTGANIGIHDLAKKLTNGKTIYPCLIILNPENQIIFRQDGFLKVNELLNVLTENKKTAQK